MRISLRGLSRQDRYLRLARWRDCCGAGAGDPDRPPRARRSGSCRSRERADRFAQNSLPWL